MQTKQPLTVLATLLFLLGVFGYIFPTWQATRFTENENLFHIVMAVLLWIAAAWDPKKRLATFFIAALIFLALGIFGFTLKDPTVFANNRIVMRFDEVDNYLHLVFSLALAWFWLKNRRPV